MNLLSHTLYYFPTITFTTAVGEVSDINFLLVKQVLKSLPDAKDAPLTIQVRKLNQHNCMYTTVQMITSC